MRQVGVKDELDYQKTQRTRELLRDLENSVINGARRFDDIDRQTRPTRRTMRGIRSFITTNQNRRAGTELPTNVDPD